MKKKTKILFFLAALLPATFMTFAGTRAEVDSYPNVTNQAWKAGEKLDYAVRYGPIRAGSTSFVTTEIEKMNDRRILKIEHRTKSANFFFYKLENEIISLIDMNGLFSWKSIKKQIEGKQVIEEETEYVPSERIAKRAAKGKKSVEKTSAYVKDMLGALFFLRTQSFKEGDVITVPVHDGGKSYDLEVAVRGKETVRVPAGTFNCLIIEPKLKSEGIFSKKGRLLIWVTDDQRHIPVRIRTMVSIGTVVASLERMDGSLP